MKDERHEQSVTDCNHLGNAAKMRDALKEFVEYSNLVCKMGMFNRDRLFSITKKASDALSASARNCDVGTAEEQAERFHAFCASNKKCGDVYSSERCQFNSVEDCELAWAQMPYEEGAEDGK